MCADIKHHRTLNYHAEYHNISSYLELYPAIQLAAEMLHIMYNSMQNPTLHLD